MKIVRARKEQYGDQHLASRRQLKKRTQGNCGSQKKLAAACRLMTCRAGTAWHQGHNRQGPGRENVVQGAPKG
jgi:hypothetical protein